MIANFRHSRPKLVNPGLKMCARSQTITPIVINDIGSGSGAWSCSTLPTGLSHSNGVISGTVDAGATVESLPVTVTRGTVSVTFTLQVFAAFIEVDSGDTFPYNCNTANRLYVCTEPCVSDGTLFAINAAGVGLDLGGFSHTYDNSTPITVPNGSFEVGSGAAATGWDFTNAPNAERFAGTYAYNEIYDGDYSLKFSDTTATEYVESTATVELLPNTTYSLSAMMEYGGQGDHTNPGVVMYVSLVGTGAESTVTCQRSTSNNRGIQFQEQQFTTGAGTPTYNIRVGITGHASAVDPVFIDDVKIQTTKRYGAFVSPFAVTGDIVESSITDGFGTNAKIVNGGLQQGQAKGTWCHAVAIRGTSGLVVRDIVSIVNGPNASFLKGLDMASSTRAIIADGCELTSENRTITTRDAADGALFVGTHGTFSNNIIRNGPHMGIVALPGTTPETAIPSTINGNRVYTKAKYTNAFGIIGGYGGQICDNEVICGTGDYNARGIMCLSGVAGAPSRMYRNKVEVQFLSDLQEYENANVFGQYGVQLEDVSNCEVYNNHVTARGNVYKAFAFRVNGTESSTGVVVHHNTFVAVATDVSTGRAGCMKLDTVPDGSMSCHHNTLITNNELLSETRLTYLELERCTVAVQNQLSSSKTINVEHPYDNAIDFIDCDFADAGSRTALENATMVRWNSATTESGTTTRLQWTTTIHVETAAGAPVAGATVTIDDTAASEVFSGTTDAAGNIVTQITEWSTTAGTRTDKNDHTADASGSGLTGQEVFTADQPQTITIVAT